MMGKFEVVSLFEFCIGQQLRITTTVYFSGIKLFINTQFTEDGDHKALWKKKNEKTIKVK